MNGFFASGQMSSEEKQNILSQHKTIYDGYVTRHNQNLNPQPLYVQDFANDKEGLVVNNKGDVKTYTNVGINESTDEMKEDLGIENLKLGKKYKIKAAQRVTTYSLNCSREYSEHAFIKIWT